MFKNSSHGLGAYAWFCGVVSSGTNPSRGSTFLWSYSDRSVAGSYARVLHCSTHGPEPCMLSNVLGPIRPQPPCRLEYVVPLATPLSMVAPRVLKLALLHNPCSVEWKSRRTFVNPPRRSVGTFDID